MSPAKCYITDLPTSPTNIRLDHTESYSIKVDNETYVLNFTKYEEQWVEGEELKELQDGTLNLDIDQLRYRVIYPIRHILAGLIYNHKWSLKNNEILNLKKVNEIQYYFSSPSSLFLLT